MEILQAWVTVGKDIITGLSALTAAIVAVLGLQAWKKQLRGRTEYELAQRLLHSVYKVRQSFAIVRESINTAGETAEAMRDAGIEGDPLKDEKVHAQSTAAVYEKRWKKVSEAFLQLESLSLEAEAIWGTNALDSLKPLHACGGTLYASLLLYLRNMHTPPRSADDGVLAKVTPIIYGYPNDVGENSFSDEIRAAVSKAEDFLKPRLRI